MSIFFNAGGKVREPSEIYFGGGNGKPLKIREVYVGRDGKPVLVWQKGVGKRYICHKTSKLTYYSADLITWHEMSGCTDSVWLNPVYGNGILFASYGGKSYVSRDGKIWNKLENITDRLEKTVFGNGIFQCVQSVTGGVITFLRSTDGIQWDSYSFDSGYASSAALSQLFFANNLFILILRLSTGYYAIYTSADGMEWKKVSAFKGDTAGIYSFETLYYACGKYIIASYMNAIQVESRKIMYSTDLVTWTQCQGSATNLPSVRSVTYGKGKIILCTHNGYHRYSTDGVNWIFGSSVDSNTLTCCIFADDRFVGVGGKNIYVSTDAVSWEQVSVSPYKTVFSKIMYTG